MNYQLKKLQQSRIQVKSFLKIDDKPLDLNFIYSYVNFHEWTQVEDLLNDNQVYESLEIFQNEIPKDLIKDFSESEKVKIINNIFQIIQSEFKKELEFIQHHLTGTIPESAYRENIIEYDIKAYPRVIDTYITPMGEKIELRQSDEKLKYVKKNEEGDIIRDEKGLALFLTEEEMDQKGYNKYSTTILAFNEQEKSIGLASDEWGADGIWVNQDYQKQGIGLTLLTAFRKQFPESRIMGQMTYAGRNLARSFFRKNVLKI